MNIRRFTAKNIGLALEMVKEALGEEAVILKTGKVRKKDPGTGKIHYSTEVLAAVDLDLAKAEKSQTSPGNTSRKKRKQPANKPERDGRQDLNSGPEDGGLSRELESIKKLLGRVVKTVQDNVSAPTAPSAIHQNMAGSAPLLVIHQVFTSLGIDPVLQQSLACPLLAALEPGQVMTPDRVLAWLQRYLLSGIKTGPQLEDLQGPAWWAVIGPTGVGKTTTIAKLAARLKFRKGMKGCLVTVDTFRLGGVEQLRRYAELMDIPMETARNSQSLIKTFSDHRDKDFILVDTTGRNPGDPRHRQELGRMFEAVPGLKGQVILCATAKNEDLENSIDCYSMFPLAGWTLSKVDETTAYGPLYSPVIDKRLPISYVTNGQRVPEDIMPASPGNLSRLLINQKQTGISRQKKMKTTSSLPSGHHKCKFNAVVRQESL